MIAASGPTRLFVVGVGRSGTSLLQAMLGSHPDIEFLPETGFLRRHGVSAPSADTPLDEAGRRALARAWREDTRLARVDGAAAAIEATLAAASDATGDTAAGRSARQLSLALYAALTPRAAGRFVGDKDPRLIEHIETLLALWPDCRVVHIHRDPRDVLASKKAARWSAAQGALRQIAASALQFDLALRAERRLPPSAVHTLSYEALLANPEGVLRPLCDWLDIAYTPAMLDFAPTAKRLVAADEMSWKARTLGPLLNDNSGGWTERLSDFEAAAVESACRAAMRRGGHARSTGGSRIRRIAGTAVGLAVRGAAAVYVRARRRAAPVPEHAG